MTKAVENAEDLDGYEDLRDEDKAKIDTAWEVGHVADEDIPASARKPAKEDDDGEEKPKKKRAPAKKKVCVGWARAGIVCVALADLG